MALTAIEADGWRGTYGSPPTEFDPVGAPVTFTVDRPGFNSSGTGITVTDTVTLIKRVRLPYPDQATLTSDKVALSDFIYSGDVISGVTNNSTRLYPLPIFQFLTEDMLIIRGSTMNVQLAVAHGHARNGKPVAAVKLMATDGTHTTEQVISVMTSRYCPKTQLYIPVFEADLDVSGMDSGATLTIDAIIYPWVGDACTISAVAETYPANTATTLTALYNPSSGLRAVYAYVDSVSGNDATGVASLTAGTAAASPYLTIGNAGAGIKAFNNTNYANNAADGGIIRLVEGVHTWNEIIKTKVLTNYWPVTVEASDPTKKATTVLTDKGATLAKIMPRYIRFKDLVIRRSVTGSIVCYDQDAGNANYFFYMSCINVTFDVNTAATYGAYFYKNPRQYMLDCDGDVAEVSGDIVGIVNKSIMAIGCDGFTFTNAALGCRGTGLPYQAPTVARAGTKGPLYGWNVVSNPVDGNKAAQIDEEIGVRGSALIGNTFENLNGNTGPALSLTADGVTTPTQNLVLQLNTVNGSRTNILYQDTGTTEVAKSGYVLGNLWGENFNIKGDLFTSNGNTIGNWPVRYKTGFLANTYVHGDSSGGITVGPYSWLGEVMELGAVWPATGPVYPDPDYINDTSYSGSNLGGGDYMPYLANEVATIPAGRTPYPIDLYGEPVPTDGTALSGAVQMYVPMAGDIEYLRNADVTTITDGGTEYTVYSFRRTGSVIFSASTTIEYLVVGGGGGGGSLSTRAGAGGGAGGLLTGSSTATDAAPYPITVGAGGSVASLEYGRKGGDSSIGSAVVAIGGGGGAGGSAPAGNSNGGSGGGGNNYLGGSGTGVSGQGHDGANGNSGGSKYGERSGGGGGGAGSAGVAGAPLAGGDGGAGVTNTIQTGVAQSYAGGGGGGAQGGSGGAATHGGGAGALAKRGGFGVPNTGGGGGGYGASAQAGPGGSGIVVFRIAAEEEPTSAVGVIAGTVSSALAVTARALVSAVIVGAVAITGSGTGSGAVAAALSGAAVVTCAATATVRAAGVLQGAVGVTGGFTGKSAVRATLSGGVSATGIATAVAKVAAQLAGPATVTGQLTATTASGALCVLTGGVAVTATLASAVSVKGALAGVVGSTGALTAKVAAKGQIAGGVTATGQFAGSSTDVRTAAIAGTVDVVWSAAGKVAVKAATVGTATLTATVAAVAPIKAQLTGLVTVQGAAVADASNIGDAALVGAGTVIGTATGKVLVKASLGGAVVTACQATVTVTGAGGYVPDPHRVIYVTPSNRLISARGKGVRLIAAAPRAVRTIVAGA